MSDFLKRLRAAEAEYQDAHKTCEHIYREMPDKSQPHYKACKERHGRAVARKERAESAVKSLRAESYALFAAAVDRLLANQDKPIYLQPAGLSDRVVEAEYPYPFATSPYGDEDGDERLPF